MTYRINLCRLFTFKSQDSTGMHDLEREFEESYWQWMKDTRSCRASVIHNVVISEQVT